MFLLSWNVAAILRSPGRPLNSAALRETGATGLERLLERGQLVDDVPDVTAHRLALYHEQTMPVVDRYRRLDKIDADQTIGVIECEIKAVLDWLERDRNSTGTETLWRSTGR